MIPIILAGLCFVLPFHAVCASSMISGDAVIPDAAPVQDQITRSTASAEAALERALAREADLKDYPVWENVKRLAEWLDNIKILRETGDLGGAYLQAQSFKTSWYARQADQAANAMPLMVLGPIGVEQFTDRDCIVPRPAPGALDEPYLGEFETAPTNATYALASGSRTYYKLARTLDPWQARDELAGAGMDVPLRQAWLVGDRLDFAESVDVPADAWGIYYIWGEVYAPTRRGMNLDLVTQAPCMYLWRSGSLYVARRCPVPASLEYGITLRGGGFNLLEGWNRIFIKMLMRPGDAFSMRFMHHPHRDGYMDDLQYRLPEQKQ